MSKAIAEFADEMMQHFPPFRQWEDYQEKAWANTLAAELAGFSSEVLTHAKKQIIRTRRPNMPRPPMVSECIDACLESRRLIEKDKLASQIPDLTPSASRDWSAERVKLAHDSIKTDMGREAARDGWISTLWNFIREHQRMPKGHEIEACKRQAREFMDTYKLVLRGECVDKEGVIQKLPKEHAEVLQKLGSSMLAKREELAREVMGR